MANVVAYQYNFSGGGKRYRVKPWNTTTSGSDVYLPVSTSAKDEIDELRHFGTIDLEFRTYSTSIPIYINNIIAEVTVDNKYPPFTTIVAGACDSHNAGSGMNTGKKKTTACPAHHEQGKEDDFAKIYNDGLGGYDVRTNEIISHFNANTMKFALRSLSKGYARPAYGHGKIYSTLPLFTAYRGSVVRYSEWNSLRNVLRQFGDTSLPVISIGTRIDASFFQHLRAQYNYYKGQCLCDSDCGCNTVCTCNGDCGCHY